MRNRILVVVLEGRMLEWMMTRMVLQSTICVKSIPRRCWRWSYRRLLTRLLYEHGQSPRVLVMVSQFMRDAWRLRIIHLIGRKFLRRSTYANIVVSCSRRRRRRRRSVFLFVSIALRTKFV